MTTEIDAMEAPINQTLTLNDLPEELLLRILTFLPDSVQTSLISQKWRHLWSRVPSLNLPFELFPPRPPPSDSGQLFADFVDRVLIRRSKSPIATFRLSFIYHHCYGSRVDSWVHAAVHHLRARRLHLDFFIHKDFHSARDENDNHQYDFPFSVLRNGSVETLGLCRCDLTLPENLAAMRFSSIRSMVLDQVFLTDEMVRDLILGCPNLEALELQSTWGHHHLKICSSRLKKLVLGYFYVCEELKESILVDCPNLRSITFDCCGFDRFWLRNASSLVEFRLSIPHWIKYYGYWSKVAKLLEQAPNIKHLGVQNWWFKFLTPKDSLPKSFMLHSLILLELKTGFTQYDLLGMAALLKLSPNLETMILEYLYKIEEDENLPDELSNQQVEFSIPKLKQVIMTSYTGTEDENNFLKILMKQEAALKKIVLAYNQVEENVKVGEKSVRKVVVYRKATRLEAVSRGLSSTAPESTIHTDSEL